MFGIGMQELIIILIVALIFIGPKKLPDLAKALGKGVAQFRNAMDDVKSTFHENDIKKEVDQFKDTLLTGGEPDKKPDSPSDPYKTAEEKQKNDQKAPTASA